MTTTPTSPRRRQLLRFAAGGLAALALPGLPRPARAQPGAPARLDERFSVIDAGGSNVLVFDAGDGLVLVDSGTPAHADTLLATLDSLGGGVRTLFNTHWHAEQLGANAALGQGGAHIIAHAKTRQRLATDWYLPHEQRYHKALPAAALPAQTIHDKGTLEAGGETIEFGHLVEAHTDGDIYVYFREANVLAVGDAMAPARDPELDWYGGGWLGGRVNSLERLAELCDDATRIVPAFGPVVDRAELLAERDIMQEVYNRVLDLIRSGCSAECMVEEGALAGLGRTWRDPYKFLHAAYKGMWAHHNNLAPNIL